MRLITALLVFLPSCLAAQLFSEVPDTPFTGVAASSADFADVDGDGDKDLLIAGVDAEYHTITTLYIQEAGVFTIADDAPFTDVSGGKVEFADVDGDGDPDVLLTGINPDLQPVAKLYQNAGGTFTEVPNIPFATTVVGSASFVDSDTDGDPDVFITGRTALGDFIARLYINESGTFTEIILSDVAGVSEGDFAFEDVDNDGDPDLLLSGLTSQLVPSTTLYLNEDNNFSAVVNTPFEPVLYGDVAFADIDGDEDQDLLLTGRDTSFVRIARLYANVNGSFSEVPGTSFTGVSFSSAAFADVTGDDQPEMIISGVNNDQEAATNLYLNSNGSFSPALDIPFVQVGGGSVTFSDVDNDNDLDVLITGYQLGVDNEREARLYLNERVSTAVSGPELANDDLFIAWPNPVVVDKINARLQTNDSGTIDIRLFDARGNLLSQRSELVPGKDTEWQISLKDLPAGIYFLQIITKDKKGIKRIVRY